MVFASNLTLLLGQRDYHLAPSGVTPCTDSCIFDCEPTKDPFSSARIRGNHHKPYMTISWSAALAAESQTIITALRIHVYLVCLNWPISVISSRNVRKCRCQSRKDEFQENESKKKRKNQNAKHSSLHRTIPLVQSHHETFFNLQVYGASTLSSQHEAHVSPQHQRKYDVVKDPTEEDPRMSLGP